MIGVDQAIEELRRANEPKRQEINRFDQNDENDEADPALERDMIESDRRAISTVGWVERSEAHVIVESAGANFSAVPLGIAPHTANDEAAMGAAVLHMVRGVAHRASKASARSVARDSSGATDRTHASRVAGSISSLTGMSLLRLDLGDGLKNLRSWKIQRPNERKRGFPG